MSHPRDEREWRREVERRLAMQGTAISSVSGLVTTAAIEKAIGKQPTAPIELVADTSIYMNSQGEWRGRFTLDFPDVTVDVEGHPIQIGWYELQGQSGGALVLPVVDPNVTSGVPIAGNWTQKFGDEFTGGSVDTSKWRTNWYAEGGNMNNVGTYSANSTVVNGELRMKLSDATSGALIHTDFTGGYRLPVGGYVEARIWFPATADGTNLYNWPAFWASSSAADVWPNAGEHDIAEVLTNGSIGELTVNYHDPTGNYAKGTVPGAWGNGWHTYGLHRKQGSAQIYWDGKLVKSYSTNDNHNPEILIFNMGKSNSRPVMLGDDNAMRVDWIRAWEPVGSTASATAQAIAPQKVRGQNSMGSVRPPLSTATAKASAPMMRSYDGGAPFRQMATSNTSSLRVDDLDPGSMWVFRARAYGVNSPTPGVWSATVSVTILRDTLPPQQLTQPVATVSRGTITVTWDGQAVTGQLPADFAYAELAAGTSASPTEIVARFYQAGGFTVISDVPYYDPQFYRIRAVDESGNKGPWSQQEVAYVTPLVDEDVILSTIDAAKTLLINVDAGVSILSSTILTRHLVVTEDMTVALLAAHKIVAGDIAANAIETDKLVAGSVTASKLESTLVLASEVIAGDPAGTHAQMDENGFRVFADDPADGIPNEVVRMGVASTNDYFAVTRSDGTLAAAISQEGIGSFAELNSGSAFYYKGNELTQVLDIYPRGPLFKTELNADIDNITTEYGLIEAEFITDGTDRQIRIDGGVLFFPVNPATEAIVQLRYTTDGSTPSISSTLLVTVPLGDISTSVYDTKNFSHTIRPMTSVGNTPGMRVRILMTIQKGNGESLKPRAGLNTYLYLTDIGKGIIHTPNHNNGGGSITYTGAPPPPPPAPVVQNYYKEYGCYASYNYDGAGNRYTFNDSQMFQGLSPAGWGNLKSIGVFGDMTADLAGATVTGVRVFFNFNWWYYNSGGTARIGVHGLTSLPGTDSGRGPLSVISGGWPKPGARWVDLSSSHWDGFRTGAYRGVYLEGDGTYNTYGYADRPVIGISYTK